MNHITEYEKYIKQWMSKKNPIPASDIYCVNASAVTLKYTNVKPQNDHQLLTGDGLVDL